MATRANSAAKKASTEDVLVEAKAVLLAAAARRAEVEQTSAQEPLSAADRENPDKLTGDALRTLAHRRGVSRSEAEHMSDDKLRMQLRYITNRQYAEEG